MGTSLDIIEWRGVDKANNLAVANVSYGEETIAVPFSVANLMTSWLTVELPVIIRAEQPVLIKPIWTSVLSPRMTTSPARILFKILAFCIAAIKILPVSFSMFLGLVITFASNVSTSIFRSIGVVDKSPKPIVSI